MNGNSNTQSQYVIYVLIINGNVNFNMQIINIIKNCVIFFLQVGNSKIF